MTAPAVPLAVFCAAECDISGAMCQRIQCDGLHNPHGQDAWRRDSDYPTDNDARRTE